MTLKEQHCCADVELLTVALRPFCLPREFRQIFVTVVYIHPRADVRVAAGVIRHAVQKQETQCPSLSASSLVISTTAASTRPCPTTTSMSPAERVEIHH